MFPSRIQVVIALKNEEEKELELWEKEMESVKAQIEKVDQDIFSKVE